ncbi:MAG: hypothetical protein AB8I08_21160 [Sandaracinaceae bacterium]
MSRLHPSLIQLAWLLPLLGCAGSESSAGPTSAEQPPAEAPTAAQPEPDPEPEAPEPAAAGEGADPPDPCSVLTAAADSWDGDLAPSVNGEDITMDLEALGAVLPASAAGHARGDFSRWPRGESGHVSPGAEAFYSLGDAEVGVAVDDLVHVCSCAPGMGEVLQRRALAGAEDALALQISGHPAVLNERANGFVDLEIWVNDRCRVRLTDAPADVLRSVAGALDWSALSTLCAAR